MPRSASSAACSFLVVAWQSLAQGLDALEFGDGFNLLDIPHHPFYFVIAFGSLAFALVLVVLGLRSAIGLPEIARRKADE